MASPAIQPGRFVVRLPTQSATGLAADEVIELLRSSDAADASIFRIHRIDTDGRMELVGVPAAAFAEQDIFLFSRCDMEAARSDFEMIRKRAAQCPPPCRIDLELAEIASVRPSFAAALIFCLPCSEAVGAWLRTLDRQPGDHADAGRAALAAFRSSSIRLIDHALLETYRTTSLPIVNL